MAPARRLCCRKFRPSVALILLKPTSWISSGSAPYLRTVTRLLTSAGVKLPVIWPCPPVIGSLMDGAEMTVPSRTMANCSPTCPRS